jgi:ABC-type transport system involved in multi-copper enzyme maturation permease subunit
MKAHPATGKRKTAITAIIGMIVRRALLPLVIRFMLLLLFCVAVASIPSLLEIAVLA